MTAKTLIAAAEAVRSAHGELERIDGQAAGLRQRLEEMDGQQATLTGHEERRSRLLEEALLAGRKADTSEVDKQITTAQRAIERRKDERTAVERALPALETQSNAAAATLATRRAEYDQARAEHTAACVRTAITAARELSTKLGSAIADILACIDLIPANAPEHGTLHAELDALKWELIETTRDSFGNVRVIWAPQTVAGPVTSQAQLDLDRSREVTGIPEAREPTLIEPAELGYLWSDGLIHPEPEPASESVYTVHANRGDGPSRITLHPADGYTPGFVRSL